jgi:hypothetical protein
MKNFKFNPKIALIVTLILITGVGVYIYLSTTNNFKKTNQVEDRGFLSFFGDRKVKPVDETTVPGVTPTNTVGSNTAGSIDAGDVDLNNGSNVVGGSSGNLSLKPIGVNTIVNGGSGSASTNTTGGTGTEGRSTSGATGGNTTGGSTGTTVNPPSEQVNCTPKEIEFTEAEKKKLKELEVRFYQVAAEIKTEQDVETLVRTRQNYYNYLSSDYSVNSRKDGTGVVELTKQCFTERNKSIEDTLAYEKERRLRFGSGLPDSDLDKKYPLANKSLGLRPSPFITKDMFNKMASVSPFRQFLNKERQTIISEIKKTNLDITESEEKIKLLFTEAEKKLEDYNNSIDNDNPNNLQASKKALNDYNIAISRHDNEKARLFTLREKTKNLDYLLNQNINDPFSYFANNTTYIVYEKPISIETKLSRLNNVYQNVQSMFYNTFEWGDILDKFWGGGDWSKASGNPLKDSGFAIPCDSVPIASKTTNPLVCYENSYPMQNLERFLGIW